MKKDSFDYFVKMAKKEELLMYVFASGICICASALAYHAGQHEFYKKYPEVCARAGKMALEIAKERGIERASTMFEWFLNEVK